MRLLASLAFVVAVAMWARPAPAHACSGGPSPELFDVQGFSEWSDAIVVGEVVREEGVGAGTYASTLDVAAVLLGEPVEEVHLPVLGVTLGNCWGGPRLPEGQRVIAFLEDVSDESSSGATRWQISLMGYGVYHLDGEDAVLDRTPWGEPENPLPWQTDRAQPAVQLIEEIAAANQSEPDEVRAALAFVRGDQADSRALIALLAATGLLAATLVLARTLRT